jgi:hypothetical protein
VQFGQQLLAKMKFGMDILTIPLKSPKKCNMPILQIEHKVPNFDGWKRAFDSDPINRKKSGVRRYQIFQPTDDPNYVILNLDFDHISEAETTLTALRNLWNQVEGSVMIGPKTKILHVIESKEY